MLWIVAINVQGSDVESGKIDPDYGGKHSVNLLKSGIQVADPESAFRRFQDVLAAAVKMPKQELDRRIALDNATRTADRVQRGYKKRGPKPR
jgi:hypothetical protein